MEEIQIRRAQMRGHQNRIEMFTGIANLATSHGFPAEFARASDEITKTKTEMAKCHNRINQLAKETK